MRWSPIALLLCLLTTACKGLSVESGGFFDLDRETLRVCTASQISAPPGPNHRTCRRTQFEDVRTHGDTVWVIGTIDIASHSLEAGEPLGLFLGAKAASRVFVNGHEIGSNGTPGLQKYTEAPGQIDVAFYVPETLLQPGENQIAILMSGHHSVLNLPNQLIFIEFGSFTSAPFHERDYLTLRMIVLGVILVAGLYGATFALSSPPLRVLNLLLPLAAGFASIQLLAETTRTFWSYPYPYHDLRLALITLGACFTGLAMLAHVCFRLRTPRKSLLLFVTALVTFVAIILTPDFHSTAAAAALVPSLMTCGVALWSIRRERIASAVVAVVFGGFALANLLNPRGFLDQNYYVALSFIIVYLAISQARSFKILEGANTYLEHKNHALEETLKTENSTSKHYISIKHSSRIDYIDADNILHIQANGNYATICLIDGKKVFTSNTLGAVEEGLPTYFLRVHRSHIVNVHKVVSLKRAASGTGVLTLNSNATVPISRRAMPVVRKALTEGSDEP